MVELFVWSETGLKQILGSVGQFIRTGIIGSGMVGQVRGENKLGGLLQPPGGLLQPPGGCFLNMV